MQENRKDIKRQQRKWLKDYEKRKKFLATPKGQKQALNALERELKKIVIEYQKQLKDIIEKWTPYYSKKWKAKWRINKEVDVHIKRELGFTERPNWIDVSDRTLDRNVFLYIDEIKMAKLIQEKNAYCTSLKCDCRDYDCTCKIEEEQEDLAWLNDYHEYLAKGGKDAIRLMELIYNLTTYEASETILNKYLKYEPRKSRNDKNIKAKQEQLGSKAVSVKRLQYESLGYYTKKCEICNKCITIKENIPYDYDSNNFHSCFEDGSNKK